MFIRTRIMLVLLFLFTIVAASAGPAAAQPDDPEPTWVDTMDSAATGLLSEASPDESRFTYQYFNGEYSIQAHATDYTGDLYSYLNVGQLTDTRTAVDVAIDEDGIGKYVFVGCRAGPNDNGYGFEVHTATGDVRIWILEENGATILAEGNAAEFIAPGFVYNTIEIECWQSIISGAVNGEVILAEFDTTFTSGFSYVGAGVDNNNPGNITVYYDNLSVIDFNAQLTDVSAPTPAEGAAVTQPGPAGAIAYASENPPTQGPFRGTAEVFDGDLKSLYAEVDVTTFYAELGFLTPVGAPPGFWTVGFCFWIDANDDCVEVVAGSDGMVKRWIAGDYLPTYEGLDFGELPGLDLTPGAENFLGLHVDGTTATLMINGESPAATIALPRTASGDVAAVLSFNADNDNESGSFVFETFGFAVWDLGATTGGMTAPASVDQPTPTQPTVAAQPNVPSINAQGLFEQLRSQAQTQAPIAGPLSSQLVQSAVAFPWAPAGVNLTDLYTSATFVNPQDTSQPWDIGLAIRYTGDNAEARIIATSDGSWSLTIGSGQPAASGQLTSFATGPGALNTFEVAASGPSGVFALNGLVIAELDLSGSPGSGDVFASSGFLTPNVVEGRVVSVQEFSVWAIPAAGPAPTATQVAQTTTQPSGDLTATFQQQKSAAVLNAPLTGPLQGVLTQQAAFLSQGSAGVNVADLYAAATFLNPADTSVPWDFGITLRGTGVGDELRFFVTSNGDWYVASRLDAPIASGQVSNINASPGGANTIEVTAQGLTGVAVVNGEPVATLDFSSVAPSGDVYVATGFFDSNIVADRQISFVTFQVWPIEATDVGTSAPANVPPEDPSARFIAARSAVAGQAPVAGPFSGVLTQSATTFPFALGGVNLADFYTTATFANPADLSQPWNIGWGLRYSDQNLELRFIIDSGGNWSFATGGAETTFGGTILWFNSDTGGSNTLEAVVQGVTAYVAVNGQFVTSFDLSANAPSGDVFIGAGFAGSGIVEGRQIAYSEFSIWALPAGI